MSGWHWKQMGYNAFLLSGPLGSSKWFDTYGDLYRFCKAKGIDATQV